MNWFWFLKKTIFQIWNFNKICMERNMLDSRARDDDIPEKFLFWNLGKSQASVGPALNFEIAISTKSEKSEQTPKTRRNRRRQPDKNTVTQRNSFSRGARPRPPSIILNDKKIIIILIPPRIHWWNLSLPPLCKP